MSQSIDDHRKRRRVVEGERLRQRRNALSRGHGRKSPPAGNGIYRRTQGIVSEAHMRARIVESYFTVHGALALERPGVALVEPTLKNDLENG